MEAVEARRRAVAAAMSTVADLGLAVEDAVVLSESNRLVLRLSPCDVVVRLAPIGYRVFPEAGGVAREVVIVQRLAQAGAPVAPLDPRVEPRVFVRDGFEMALWTSFDARPSGELSSEDYAHALGRVHDALRLVDIPAPHFTDRVGDVQRWVARRDVTPDLADEDRELLLDTLASLRRSIVDRGAPEQLLHGEPHPWNVLATAQGPRFVDFENAVRGPVELDLGWVPTAVSDCAAGVDPDLVEACRGLVLAIVAAHGWRLGDQRPGRESGLAYLDLVRKGPPWAALDAV